MRKYSLSKFIMFVAPYLAYTLIFAVPYAVGIYTVYNVVLSDMCRSQLYYLILGLSICIPMMLLELANRRINYFWQYLAFSLLLVALSIFIADCYIYPVVVAILAAEKTTTRVREEESFTQSFHWALLFLPPIYFIVAGFNDLEFLQFTSLITCIILCVLYFLYDGLIRVEEYLYINKKMANFPYMRIKQKGNNLFFGISFLLLVTLIPLAVNNYEFVHLEIVFEEVATEEEEEILEQEEVQEGSGESESLQEMLGTSEPWVGWEVLSYVFGIGIIIFGAIAFYKAFREFLKNFTKNSVIIEKDDVIESTVDLMEKYAKFKKDKSDKIRFFDFSPNALVRKKYKKSVKAKRKKEIQNWQSPSEIEKVVNLKDEKLHNLYEKARYSETGVTKEEI